MIKNEQNRAHLEVLPWAAIGAVALAILVGAEQPNKFHHVKEALIAVPSRQLPPNSPDFPNQDVTVSLAPRVSVLPAREL